MQTILLTGATGLLGIHLLKEILTNSDSYVHLIVRGKDDDQARARVIANWEQFFGEVDIYPFLNRINVVKGDQTLVDFGIDAQSLKLITKSIDEIFHSAALTELGSL